MFVICINRYLRLWYWENLDFCSWMGFGCKELKSQCGEHTLDEPISYCLMTIKLSKIFICIHLQIPLKIDQMKCCLLCYWTDCEQWWKKKYLHRYLLVTPTMAIIGSVARPYACCIMPDQLTTSHSYLSDVSLFSRLSYSFYWWKQCYFYL